jgi:hypothetical protein
MTFILSPFRNSFSIYHQIIVKLHTIRTDVLSLFLFYLQKNLQRSSQVFYLISLPLNMHHFSFNIFSDNIQLIFCLHTSYIYYQKKSFKRNIFLNKKFIILRIFLPELFQQMVLTISEKTHYACYRLYREDSMKRETDIIGVMAGFKLERIS